MNIHQILLMYVNYDYYIYVHTLFGYVSISLDNADQPDPQGWCFPSFRQPETQYPEVKTGIAPAVVMFCKPKRANLNPPRLSPQGPKHFKSDRNTKTFQRFVRVLNRGCQISSGRRLCNGTQLTSTLSNPYRPDRRRK